MKVSHRLYLTVSPAILGVFLVAGLAYWGEYARSAPGLVVVLGAVAVFASLVLTWANARDVARRIERLAGVSPPPIGTAPLDEIDQIERAVDRLSTEVERAESSRVGREQVFERRMHDYAVLLASIADASTRRLEEVRLPLHILLDNHFGELNENQEEMLGAARAAAEAADADMLSLRQIAAMELGERPMRHDRMKAAEIIEALRALLLSTADSAGVTLEFEVAPVLPAFRGDRVRLQEALVTLLRGAVGSAADGTQVRLVADRAGAMIRFVVHAAGTTQPTVRWAAAVRVVQAHEGSVARGLDGLSIELPMDMTARDLIT